MSDRGRVGSPIRRCRRWYKYRGDGGTRKDPRLSRQHRDGTGSKRSDLVDGVEDNPGWGSPTPWSVDRERPWHQVRGRTQKVSRERGKGRGPSILRGCRWVLQCVRNQGKDGRRTWRKVSSRRGWGPQISSRSSVDHSEYVRYGPLSVLRLGSRPGGVGRTSVRIFILGVLLRDEVAVPLHDTLMSRV